MAAPDAFKVADQLRDTFLSYLTSALPIGNHESQRELGRQFFEQWSSELFAGPMVEGLPTYEKVDCLDELFGDVRDKSHPDFRFAAGMNTTLTWADVDHRFPQYRKVRDSIWPPHSDEAEEEELETYAARFWKRRLYRHQWASFERVIRDKRNLIVATSTGSGKTECYLIPLLYELLSEPPSHSQSPGVRALLLYPMNALVEDQMHRLRQLLFWVNLQSRADAAAARRRTISFGRYTGATPVNPSDRDPQRHISPEAMLGLGEIAYRAEMQAAPPDILVTNFTMLEYMLLRDDDQRLFHNSDVFKFLVLDEVHTYTGTQGMEVALLLRRLRAFLQSKSPSARTFQVIGTSATLPSGPTAREQTAEFASTLFGAPFADEDVIRPETSVGSQPFIRAEGESSETLTALTDFRGLFPALASHLGITDEDAREVPESEWETLARKLKAAPVHAAEHDISSPSYIWFRLAAILSNAPIVHDLRMALTNSEPTCKSLDELCKLLFTDAPEKGTAVTTLLKLVGAAHRDGSPILPLRFHMFVREPAAAQVCLKPDCNPERRWWSRLFLSHHTRCDHCNSFAYPLVLCRRCGFVYFEGWRRRFPSGQAGHDLFPEPDDADEKATYQRTLFRPLDSAIPIESIQLGEQRSLCLQCGRWMVAEDDPQFASVEHACNGESVIQVCSWESQLHSEVLEECIFCDQHWIQGQDVATPPAPSVYATATVLVEELERGIERNGVAPYESKLISFSDSRQQAAQLAYRFQKTNREFTFRQLMWRVLKDSAPHGLSTTEVVDELFRECRSDERLRRLLLDDETRFHDRSLLERTIASLLFRESVTAYLTLEAQGIVRVSYDEELFRPLEGVLAADRTLFGGLSESDRRAFLLFLLDWNMRYRYAIAPIPNGGAEIDWDWLERRNILPKCSVRSKAESARGELSFVVSTAAKRNRAFNFCQRLFRRLNTNRFRSEFTLGDLQQLLFTLWDHVLLPYATSQVSPLSKGIYNVGRDDADGAILKINFDALRWSPIGEGDEIFRCTACGRISSYSVGGVCPIRDCSGALEPITGEQLDRQQFSPVRHYRQLVKVRSLRPLRVEEHTAQVTPTRRQLIEQEFRRTGPNSVDVICGSTTFELGVDLGTIHAVFMSNLPPRIANYRQRAGRAGRRCGMVPFILNYVRQRPHDQYFWNRLTTFIAGPIAVPHLAISSREVISRHANALFFREVMRQYLTGRNERAPLDGPAAGSLVNDALANRRVDAIAQSMTNPNGGLRGEYEFAFRGLPDAERPVAAAARFGERLGNLQETYLPLRARDGAISVLSDYGILPSYAFPLYVDEMRLNREPADRPPRSELRLQRDRRIALQEYMPGKVIVAGKNLIGSDGVWAGYEERQFRICSNHDCQQMDFAPNAPFVCPFCQQSRTTLTALIPKGGFFGTKVEGMAEQDSDLARQRGETYFDPANEPPPTYRLIGNALNIAIVGSDVMQEAASRPRMRQFNPRPHSDLILELAPAQERDLALPNLPAVRCLRRANAQNRGTRYYLMHEYTTDITRIQILPNSVGTLLWSAAEFQRGLAENSEAARRRYYMDCWRRSLGEALLAAASQVLDIDPSELGITFHTSANVLGGKELILFDTAPGGAGYVRQLAARAREVFCLAEDIATSCDCGDSCYSCLRNYNNQMAHSRLNRHLIARGLAAFNVHNWASSAAARE